MFIVWLTAALCCALNLKCTIEKAQLSDTHLCLKPLPWDPIMPMKEAVTDSPFPYHEEGYIGIEAAKINKSSRQYSADALHPYKNFHGLNSVFQSVYKIKIDIDLRNIVDRKALDILPSDIRKLAEEAFETSEAKFHITLPGQTVNTNADETEEVRGKNAVRYSWTLRPGEYKTLMIHASLDKKNTKNQLILGIGAGLALLSAIAYLLIRKAKKKTLCNPN